MTMPSLQILLIESTDPHRNLVFEHCLYEQLREDQIYVLLWQNADSIIIGRAQNPWLEANLRYASANNIPVIRRSSGGGTVYNDHGNINFTLMMHKPLYNNTIATQIVDTALSGLGLPTMINKRNDILLNVDDKWFKISGSAYRENVRKGLHHGTILVNSHLPKLREALRPHNPELVTNSIKSVRSSVANLTTLLPQLTVDEVISHLITHFQDYFAPALTADVHKISDFDITDAFNAQLQRQHSWEWNFGKTPKFTQHLNRDVAGSTITGAITVNQGEIIEAALDIPCLATAECNTLNNALLQCHYVSTAIQSRLDQLPGMADNNHWPDIKSWLCQQLD